MTTLLARYRYRGRHRKPTHTARNVAAAAATGVVVAALATQTAEATELAPAVDWGPIIACESGGDPRAQNPRSSASGLYQFIDSTWLAYGGGQYAARAKDATPAQQTEIANRAYAAEGLRPWAASKGCWAGKTGPATPKPAPAKTKAEPPLTTPAPKAAGKHHQPAGVGTGVYTVRPGDTLS
ncbi:transglycosylase family protein, partial [Pseudonocardia asaccharolytica]